jgi:hypothetical protein
MSDAYDAYQIEMHSHLFAAWAASRAASVNGCRFSVENGRDILEGCGFVASLSLPKQLPVVSDIDGVHRIWRRSACSLAKKKGLNFSDGIAAKLINCYLKCRFVCGGHHRHPRVAALHPPIDKLLLEDIGKKYAGCFGKECRRASRKGWSKLNSDEYENLISLIRDHLGGEPLWKIEKHWKGSQGPVRRPTLRKRISF